MGKRVKFGPLVRKRAIELLGEGRSYADIRRTLKAEGVNPPPSQGWIAALAKEPKEQPPGKAGPAVSRARRPPPELPEDASLQERTLASLEYQATELLEALADARQSGDMRAVASVSRALNTTLTEQRRSTPKDAVADPDDLGDISGELVRQAAETGRAKLFEGLERLKAERATWPRCSCCGQPVRPGGG